MKEVMQQFEDRTTQRFHEYDERMKTTRQKCKEQCDKVSQKIILKDKIEKELMDKFATLDTDIQSDAIPTCVCEKSLADKVEKFCLNCGMNVGGGVILSSGVLGGIGGLAVNAWKPKALDAAIKAALDAAAIDISAAAEAAGNARGVEIVTEGLRAYGVDELCPELLQSIGNAIPFNNAGQIADAILAKKTEACSAGTLSSANGPMCTKFQIKFGLMDAATLNPIGDPAKYAIPQTIKELVGEATQGAAESAKKASESATAAITKKQTALIEAGFNNSITSIYASIIAILIIVLIMVIIYLILRYRRKKKMKKKLQYIKLLKE
ncbi:hypothetical protein PFDG_00298 [Plasmodium falciparum Dd2]|uniref:Rifin n=1 Tax=Plasmodium falciparum (isolate Dd2) TaxID=57267 RepID=A0A0L7LXG3_PLAF4|nr:hypothetical protein PFDG_00298 [Plasmodium falciparum Dd2]